MRSSQLTSISHQNTQTDQSQNIHQMLNEDYSSHQAQLHFLASQLQQQQQLLLNRINSVISFEPAVEIIIKVTKVWAQLCLKMNQKQKIGMKMKENAEKIKEFEVSAQIKKEKMLKYKDKMYQYVINGVKSIGKLLDHSSKYNLRKIVQSNIRQFVYSVIYHSKKCYSERKKQNVPPMQWQVGSQFGELFHFIKQHKSENLYHKYKQMWFIMEKQLNETITNYQRQSGNGLQAQKQQQRQSITLEQQIDKTNTHQMQLKVDMEILTCQIRRILKSAGFPHSNFGLEFIPTNLPNIFSCIVQNFSKKQQCDQFFWNRNRTISDQLGNIFYDYVEEMTQQYLTENGNGTIDQPKNCQERLYTAALFIFKQALSESICLYTSKQQLETRIHKLQQQIQIIKSLSLQLTLTSHHNINKLQHQNQISMTPESIALYTHQSISKYPHYQLNNSDNVEKVSFKVIKSMHIKASSNLSSGTSSHGNSRVTLQSPQESQYQMIQGHPISCVERVNQRTNQRLLEFGKNKLILKKQNHHFHEEIEVKRIKGVKIIGRSTVNIYFKKGYMSLELLTGAEIHGHNYKNKSNMMNNGVAKAKQWLKYFRTQYYQYIDSISFINEQDKLITMTEAKKVKRTRTASTNLPQQLNKENIQFFQLNILQHSKKMLMN